MDPRADRLFFWIRLLAFLAIILSIVLVYEYVRLEAGLGGKSFCNISRTINCDAVSQSSWARLFGFPVAGYGFAFYACVFLAGLLGGRTRLLSCRATGDVLLVFSSFSILFSLYLFLISALVIKSFCILCTGLYLINILLFICTLRLGKETSYASRVSGGLRALWNIFAVVLKGSRGAGDAADLTQARGVLVALVIIASLAFSLPDMIVRRVVVPQLKKEHAAKIGAQAVKNWRANPRAEMKFQERGLERDYRRGPASAPISIVEFSDFECPACREFYEAFEELAARYPGKINLVFKNFPLDRNCNPLVDRAFHLSACYAAVFSRCAGEQGKFWDALDYLFRLPELESGSAHEAREGIDSGAPALQLDAEALQECMKSGRQVTKLAADAREAGELGVEGTPSLWVNGKKVDVPDVLVLDSIFRDILSLSAPAGRNGY